jgi:hypothetical protein
VLCGPIVRRVEPSAVTVWLALKEACKVTLRVYAATGATTTPLLSGAATTVAVGGNLHMVAVTARPSSGGTPLASGTIFRYDLELDPVGVGATRRLLKAGAVAASTGEAKAAVVLPASICRAS